MKRFVDNKVIKAIFCSGRIILNVADFYDDWQSIVCIWLILEEDWHNDYHHLSLAIDTLFYRIFPVVRSDALSCHFVSMTGLYST
jgi:hypothetical protein